MASVLSDGDISLEPTTGSAQVRGFALRSDESRIGTIALVSETNDRVELRWNAPQAAVQNGVLMRGLKLAIQHAFEDLNVQRIEAFIDLSDTTKLRTASLCGMRREGVLRSRRAGQDQAVVSRLASDPDPYTQDGFVAILNAGLPTKRVIAQGILRDEHHRVLLCELTYKKEWDLPGGVIEPGESPATGLVRELEEELAIKFTIQGLITVNWLPTWRSWDDACVFVFDLGVADSTVVETMTLQRSEIRDVHWCDPELIAQRATGAATELLNALAAPSVPAYRESPQRS